MSNSELVSLCATPEGIIEGALFPNGSAALKWIEAENARWVQLGDVKLVSAPAVVRDTQGFVWIFGRTEDGAVHANVRRGGNWSGWTRIGDGTITDGPRACLDAGGRVVVFGRGTDGAVWHAYYENCWSEWVSLGGSVQYSPAGVLAGGTRLTVFAVGTDGALWHKYYDAGWSDWLSLGGHLSASPAPLMDGVGLLRVLGRNRHGGMCERCYDAGWQPWRECGGQMATALAAATDVEGRVHLRYLGPDGKSVHERISIAKWGEDSAVDALPEMPTAEVQKQVMRLLKEDPAGQRAVRLVTDALTMSFARAVLAAEHDEYPVLPHEERMAERFRAKSSERRLRLVEYARREIGRIERLKAEEPAVWGHVDLSSTTPVAEQLASSQGVAHLREAHGGVPHETRRKFRPQAGLDMVFRIHRIHCLEETDEVGDDTIILMGYTRAPGAQAVPFGPHDLGDFASSDHPGDPHANRWFEENDIRANYRWQGIDGTENNPFEVMVQFVEKDADLDPEVMTWLTRLVDAVALAIAGAYGWVGAAIGGLLKLAWEGLAYGIGIWQQDEVEDPIHVYTGWCGMPDANTQQTSVHEWDGGRYEVTYSWSPADLFHNAQISVPDFPPAKEREFTLLDPGPFTQIGATGASGRFGLWARRNDGRILFRNFSGALRLIHPEAVS